MQLQPRGTARTNGTHTTILSDQRANSPTLYAPSNKSARMRKWCAGQVHAWRDRQPSDCDPEVLRPKASAGTQPSRSTTRQTQNKPKRQTPVRRLSNIESQSFGRLHHGLYGSCVSQTPSTFGDPMTTYDVIDVTCGKVDGASDCKTLYTARLRTSIRNRYSMVPVISTQLSSHGISPRRHHIKRPQKPAHQSFSSRQRSFDGQTPRPRPLR